MGVSERCAPGIAFVMHETRRLTQHLNGHTDVTAMPDASTDTYTSEFRITEGTPRPGTAVLVIHGDADLHSAPELRERIRAVIEDGATTVVVDLSETTLVDSTSLGVLLRGMKRLRERNGEIRLVVPHAELRRVFEITLLDRIFALHDSREQALRADVAS